MSGPHLKPALVAVLLLVTGLAGFSVYAQRVEQRYIHALAPLSTPKIPGTKEEMLYPQRNQGSALQRWAFRQPDLLPLYGSSEVAGYPWDTSVLFRSYPTGFTTFPVGWADTTPLTFLQEFAAVGSDIRGKKLVISLSPSWFFSREMVFPYSYLGNFSALHASELTGPVNVGNPDECTIRQLAELVVELTDSASEIITVPLPPEREGDPAQRRPDITLIHGAYGWKPAIGLSEGLTRMIDWFRSVEGTG